MMADPIFDLAENALSFPSADLPAEVSALQKMRLLDHAGCLAAGIQAEGVEQLVALKTASGTLAKCQVAGYEQLFPSEAAAQINAVIARARDYCDVLYSGHHPTSTDLPVALAMAQEVGASGQDVLAAIALSIDFSERLTSLVDAGDYGFFDGNLLAYFGATLIAGRMLELSTEQLVAALGLALNRMSGSFQSNADRSIATRMIQGFAAQAGIESARMAQAGLMGPHNVLFGDRGGFYELYAESWIQDRCELLDGLGSKFLGGPDALCVKLYPSCSLTASLTDAALELASERSWEPDDIQDVHLRVSEEQDMICGTPFDRDTFDEVAAIFSVQYVTANALVRGRSKLADFNGDGLTDPLVLDLAARITTEVHSQLPFDHCEVIVKLTSGKTLSASRSFGTGWPPNGLSREDLSAKVMDCFEFGGVAQPNQIIELCNKFESQDDVSSFFRTFQGSGTG